MDWLFKFPQIDPDILLSVKRAIDGSLKTLTRNYGQSIENFFYPLQQVLIFFERVISSAPWPLVVLAQASTAKISVNHCCQNVGRRVMAPR